MTEHLKRRMGELVNKYYYKYFSPTHVAPLRPGVTEFDKHYREGFAACYQELAPVIADLKAALEFYGGKQAWSIADCSSEGEPGAMARNALNKHKDILNF